MQFMDMLNNLQKSPCLLYHVSQHFSVQFHIHFLRHLAIPFVPEFEVSLKAPTHLSLI